MVASTSQLIRPPSKWQTFNDNSVQRDMGENFFTVFMHQHGSGRDVTLIQMDDSEWRIPNAQSDREYTGQFKAVKASSGAAVANWIIIGRP